MVDPPTPGDERSKSAFRRDVEGLRGVAIGAVLLAHAGLPFAGGGYIGVDVFFVISGFLITRLLVTELERDGSISLARFYARRARRLLPLAMVVLATVVVLSGLMLSPVRADMVSRDVAAAGVYAVNWHFSSQAIDYFAADEVSPIQHFWSLAVEEQFYLAWPALLLLATWWWRRRGGAVRPAVWAVLAATFAASFAYAAIRTADTPAQAYFSTPARAWELALGGLLGIALLTRRVPSAIAAAAGWAGLAAIAAATLTFDEGTAVPGPAALLPALGAAALIAAGAGGGARGALPTRLLEVAPLRAVGRVSYAWYLWHWPLLVFAAEAWGPLSVAEGVAVTLASAIPTVLTHAWIEQPFMRSRRIALRPRAALAAGPACAGAVVGLALALSLAQPSVPTLAAADVAGAEGNAKRTLQRSADGLRPSPRRASKDRGAPYADGCLVPPKGTRSRECAYGDRDSQKTIVLLGDSHALHYFPALERVARRRGWRLVHLAKAGCPPAAVQVVNAELGRPYPECDSWRERALRRIERTERPGIVFTSGAVKYTVVRDGRKLDDGDSRAALAAGYRETLMRLRSSGTRVAVMGDTPRPPHDVAACVADSMRKLRRCAFSKSASRGRPTVARRGARGLPGVKIIDPARILCLRRLCPAVIGDVLVYRNAGHVTATFAHTMGPWLGRRLPRMR